MNKEGMTWQEWIAAAMLGQDVKAAFPKLSEGKRAYLRKAWNEGQDPSEYAANKIFWIQG